MKTSDFDFVLPAEQIAQHSVSPKDHAKLMVVDKKKKSVAHTQFFHILDYLQPGDLLVWNDSKVFKARLHGFLRSPEGEVLDHHTKPVEIFLVRPMENEGVWKVLARPGRHVQHGMRIVFSDDFSCEVVLKEPGGTILVQFSESADRVRKKANMFGDVPLPPYVKDEKHELESYQNVYADDDKEGSVAAPTAGFHFTDALIDAIKKKGIEFASVCLHVGLGTFLPVKTEKIEDHEMHSEWVEVSPETCDQINKAKAEGRRVIAVGTTTVRTLEGIMSLPSHAESSEIHPYSGDINIFITPGFEFKIIDALITNFHLPKSTLLMLVSAFAGDQAFMLSCYDTAVREKYRFFSFGDSMFIQ